MIVIYDFSVFSAKTALATCDNLNKAHCTVSADAVLISERNIT